MDTSPDVIELLLRDHSSMRDLAEQIDTVDDPVELRALYLHLVEQLSGHEAAEQDVVFPALRAALPPAGSEVIDRREGEHGELNSLLEEMRELRPMGFAFVKRGSALLLECREHFSREEETVFAQLGELFDPDQRRELGRRVLDVKRSAAAFPC